MLVSRSILHLALAALALFGAAELQAQPNSGNYGFIPLSDDEADHLENHVHKVIAIKPNKVGAARIRTHLESQNLSADDIAAAEPEEEFTTAKTTQAAAIQLMATSATLPTSVDNSTLPSFPPIGDQGELGSCVAWGSTYYQASHELGLLNGINNKTSSNGILSPKWTYNLLNGGQDNGLSPPTAFQLLNINGATSIVNFPYDANYLAWDINSNDWISALSNRLSPMVAIPGLGGSGAQNLTAIKQALNNGHVVTFATYIDSWVFTNIKTDPQDINNLHVGDLAGVWMNGTDGGHFITIVGYDDTLWIDVNGNGSVDAGERGAFLVANSWGSSWGNSGFVWVSYDAFNSVSAVSGGPNSGRVAAGEPLNSNVISVTPLAANYSPKLIGLFSLEQTKRDQISVQTGVSNTTQTTPSSQIAIPALTNQGGAYEFNGQQSSSAETSTFAVDLTDLLPAGSTPATQRYYLLCNDDANGNPTTLAQFSLKDLVHNQTVNASGLPKSFDHTSSSNYIDYDFAEGSTPSTPPPTISISSPASGATVQGTTQITVSATSTIGIASVQLLCDSTSLATDTSSPYVFSVNTSLLANGSHTFTAIATDTSNQTSQTSVALTVQNTAPTSGTYVNAGGPNVPYQGTTWITDRSYVSGASRTSAVSLSSGNPVYATARSGNMTYHFDVANGAYLVTLKFMESQFTAANRRVFNVSINGSQVLSKLDLYAVAGANTPYDRTFPITVTNKKISISFSSLMNVAIVNGIEILPQ